MPTLAAPRVALAIAVDTVKGNDADTAAAALARGSRREREDLAHLLGSGYCSHQQPILAALINDQHAPVCARAAHAIGRLANTQSHQPEQPFGPNLPQTQDASKAKSTGAPPPLSAAAVATWGMSADAAAA